MKKSRMFHSLLALSLSFSFALVGCSSSPAQTGGNTAAPAAATVGGTLIIAELSDATQLDPHKGTDIPSANVYHGKIFEGLVKQDKNMEIQPALATEWKRVDELTWEFKLRQNVTFHDGTPFTADAVKKTIARVLDKKTASPRASLFKMIKEVKVIDDHTVQLITEYPFAPLLSTLAHYAGGIISPKAIEEQGDKLGQNPAGTGPFKFESWTPGQEITMAKNENYWGDKAKVDKVVFKVIPEDTTRMAMIEAGEAHLAEPVPVNDVERVQSSASATLHRSDALGIDYIGFNLKKKPFDDVRVRQAISYAIDTDAILKGVYNNVGSKATAPMGPAVWGHNPNLKGYEYNINKAKELLAEAGYANGFSTTIWTNDNKERQNLAEVVQSQLKGIGINLEIKVVEWGAYLEGTAKGEHDMFILGWSNMTGDADYNQYFLFHTEAQGNPGNRSFYSNPEVDKLIDKGRQESDPEKRKEIYAKSQEIELQDAPIVLIRNDQDLVASGKSVKGFWMHPSGIMMLNDVTIQ